MSQDKPVAAQEPVAYYYKINSPFSGEEVWTFEPGKRTIIETKPLYDHAAPCARCAELEGDHLNSEYIRGRNAGIKELQAKITEQAAEIERLKLVMEEMNEDE